MRPRCVEGHRGLIAGQVVDHQRDEDDRHAVVDRGQEAQGHQQPHDRSPGHGPHAVLCRTYRRIMRLPPLIGQQDHSQHYREGCEPQANQPVSAIPGGVQDTARRGLPSAPPNVPLSAYSAARRPSRRGSAIRVPGSSTRRAFAGCPMPRPAPTARRPSEARRTGRSGWRQRHRAAQAPAPICCPAYRSTRLRAAPEHTRRLADRYHARNRHRGIP